MANAIVMSQMNVVEMEVSPISKLTTVWSPEVFIYGIPWKVKVYKDEDKNSLAVQLHCTKEDDTSNWAVAACATVELLPFSNAKEPLKKYIGPSVFSPSGLSFGYPVLIQWDELLKNKNSFVQNDTIQMKIKITAENPNNLERSILKFESIDKSCDCVSLAKFRLTVTNIKNLVAVRSPRFTIRGLPWDLTVYVSEIIYSRSSRESYVSVKLMNASPRKVSCDVEMSVKLLSSKDDVDPIEESNEDEVEDCGLLYIEELISWNELLKPNNGFVNNNAITLEVKIEASKPKGVRRNNAAKRRRFDCSICSNALDNQDMSTTPCGHLFCTACITKAIKKRDVCPMCQKAVQLTALKPLYLPAAK